MHSGMTIEIMGDRFGNGAGSRRPEPTVLWKPDWPESRCVGWKGDA
jgi:hypothetical protein